MKKIAIDVSQIAYGTGVAVYVERLVRNLLMVDSVNQYIPYAGVLRRKRDILNLFPSAKTFPIPPLLADLIWNRLHILPIEKVIGKVDLVHTSDWAEPPSSVPKVTTVHDLYAYRFPKLMNRAVAEVHRRKISRVIQESRRIIVPSISTKTDLMSLGGKEELIRVVPEAPSVTKAAPELVESTKKKFQINGPYLVSVGITPLKNTERIIDAFHRAKAGKDLKLMVVGRPVNMKIKEERNLRFLGHITDEDMSGLITGSEGLLYPSLYEGFGIPILDGFACGVPVVTSNVASMPEVAGEAAVLVDPYSVDSIAEGIEKILRGRRGFEEKVQKRVADFSWRKTAEMTLNVYNELLQ